jgi:hypothetical protein
MRLKYKGWIIDSSTLFRIRWKFPLPKIYVHEKFEKIAKYISRSIVAFGIIVSLFALPTLIDFGVAILLLILEVIVEKIVFEYSILIVQPLPNFKVEESQWLTNGYLFPDPVYKNQYDLQNHFGPVYKDKAYAVKFFEYLKSWNRMIEDDKENNICLSFILELDNSYTTYIYANPNRKWLDEAFNLYREINKVEKYGKTQQSMVMQMVYWKTLPTKKGTLFHSFIASQNQSSKFHFCPFYLENKLPVALQDYSIIKYNYSFRNRHEITREHIEFYYGPTIKINPDKKKPIPENPQDEINKLFEKDLELRLSSAISLEFSLADNYKISPPIIGLIFKDSKDASEAYKRVLTRFTNAGSSAVITKKKNKLTLKLKENNIFSIKTNSLDFNKQSFEKFINSEQSRGKTVLLFGFKDGEQDIFVSTEENFRPLLINKCKFK